VAPLVSQVAVPEPEIEIEEASARHDDLTSTAEESSAELETSYPTEVTPAAEAIKPAEEAKIDEETAGVAAVATGIVVASAAAVVIANELPTAQPSLVEEVTTKVDHSADIPAIEAVAATEAVIPSPEPTVKHDDEIPHSTVDPDVVSSQEPKVETEPLESENHVVERTAIEPGVIVGEETEGRIEIGPSPATQADPASVAPITTEAITEVGETVGVMEQVTWVIFFFV
jgi:hypothetical protein